MLLRKAVLATCVCGYFYGSVMAATQLSERRTDYQYDEQGNLTSINASRTDASDVTRYTYDDAGRITSTTNALGHTEKVLGYNSYGLATLREDGNGQVTDYEYDLFGRLTAIREGSRVNQLVYDKAGRIISSSLIPENRNTDYTYDEAGRLVKEKDSLGNQILYTNDAMGNVTQAIFVDAQGNHLWQGQYQYDELSRLIKFTNGVGQTNRLSYDKNGDLRVITDGNGNSVSQEINAVRQVTETKGPLNNNTGYVYDDQGRLIEVLDSTGNKTTYQYNEHSEVILQKSAATGETTFSYDNDGNLVEATDARGIKVKYQYDALNRLLAVTFPNSSENKRFSYDDVVNGNQGVGLLTSVVEEIGTTSYKYNRFGDVTGKDYTINDQSYEVLYRYNAQGEANRLTYPSGREVNIQRDVLGDIEQITTRSDSQQITPEHTLAFNVTYLPFDGPIKSYKLGNDVLASYTYNLAWQLKESALGNIQTLNYNYDPNGNLIEIRDEANNKSLFSYDKSSRLISSTIGGNHIEYQYDGIGNRLVKGQQPEGTQQSKQQNYQYQSSKLVKIDDEISTSPSSNYIARYNQAGEVAALTKGNQQTRYLYNYQSLRVLKANSEGTVHYHYNEQGILIAESNSEGQWLKEYIYLDNLLIAVIDYAHGGDNGELLYVHSDHLGTPTHLLNEDGHVVWKANYDAFGIAAIDNSANGEAYTFNIRFRGQYYDVESNLHYNWRRYYDPSAGRYIQSDPIGVGDGPNTYGYVNQNPVNLYDPDGEAAVGVAICFIWPIGTVGCGLAAIGAAYAIQHGINGTRDALAQRADEGQCVASSGNNGDDDDESQRCKNLRRRAENLRKEIFGKRFPDLESNPLNLPERIGRPERLRDTVRGHRTLLNQKLSQLRKVEAQIDKECGNRR
jgi:RHS repeat-associated protein